MFIYYEKFPSGTAADGTKTPQIMQLVLSTNGRDTFVNWKNKNEEATINLLRSIFKQVPLVERTMDEKYYIWTFFGYRGDVLIEGIKSMQIQGIFQHVEIREIEDLEEKTHTQQLHRQSLRKQEEKKFKDDDFFHQTEPTRSSNEPTGTVLIEKLAVLFEIEPSVLTNESDSTKLKKLYRAAAMRLHPDRNNGDASQMTELNYLWNIFNAGA